MSYYGYMSRRDERTERERYLEDELEREREREAQRRADEEREAERRAREREEEREASLHTASTWPEALSKQLTLLRREIRGEDAELDEVFGEDVEATTAALELWRVVASTNQGQIEALEQQIATLRDSVRTEVADALAKMGDTPAYRGLVEELRSGGSPERLLDW